MEFEEWRDVEGFESIYQVSSHGRVMSLERLDMIGRPRGSKILSPVRCGQKGKQYLCVQIMGTMERIHRLVASAFHGYGGNRDQVNHIDGNRENNCATNLEWCTGSENAKHSYDKLGRVSKGGHEGKVGKLNKLSKPIIATNIHTGEVRVFEGSADANRILGLASGSSCRACSGYYKSVKGWSMKYVEEAY